MAKFEYVDRIISTGYETTQPDFKLPERSTKFSAGYDFYAPEDIQVPGNGAITYVKTGVKIKMQEDEFLLLANRSSNPGKKELVLMNGVGIIDSDYYNNPDNDGEIAFAFSSLNPTGSFIKKGDKIGQGIIMKFIKTEDDFSSNPTVTRTGGFGSTDKN